MFFLNKKLKSITKPFSLKNQNKTVHKVYIICLKIGFFIFYHKLPLDLPPGGWRTRLDVWTVEGHPAAGFGSSFCLFAIDDELPFVELLETTGATGASTVGLLFLRSSSSSS